MKLVKTTKKHYIYELSAKEKKELNSDYNFVLFAKDNYEDCKPTFNYDIGYQEFETDTLENALEFSKNY